MKKFLALLAALVLITMPFSVFAEEADTGSEYESVALKKGSLIIREIVDYCEIKGYIGSAITFQTASAFDVEVGEKVYALRLVTTLDGKNEIAGVMDKDDVDGTIQTLEYVKAHISDINENTEVIYTAGSGVQVLADDSYLTIINSNSSRSFFM